MDTMNGLKRTAYCGTLNADFVLCHKNCLSHFFASHKIFYATIIFYHIRENKSSEKILIIYFLYALYKLICVKLTK